MTLVYFYCINFQIDMFVIKINLFLNKKTGHSPCELKSNSWLKPPLRQHQPSVAKDHEDEENNSKGSET